MTEVADRLAQRIRELRTERGFTQAEAARRAGMQRPIYTRAESGKHVLSLDVLLRLARAFEVPITVLVEVIDDRTTPEGGRWVVRWEPTP